MTLASRLLARSLALAVIACPLAATAQTAPIGTPSGQDEPKKEGAAEKAPEQPEQLPALPTLPPYPGEERKQFELLELDGYLRVRTDWFSDLNLGFHDAGEGIPFREPLSCAEGRPEDVAGACNDSIGSANLRARLQPRVNLSEAVSVQITADVLDNVVFGATPDGFSIDGTARPRHRPTSALGGDQQQPPDGGRNYLTDSIRVKHAWGEVRTALGELRFGRMPTHWGLGIMSNSGGYDPIHDTQCTDCDYGDTADRLMFGTTIPGTDYRAAVAMDWAGTAPTSAQTAAGRDQYDGQPVDLDDADDVDQYVVIIARIDDPAEWKLRLEEGRTALNYGLHFTYRTQDYEVSQFAAADPTPQTRIVRRGAQLYIPDLWARFTTGPLTIEAEVAGVFGSIANLSDVQAGVVDQSLRQLGAVARANYHLLDETLHLGFEVGFASGDQWESARGGSTDVRSVPVVPLDPNDRTMSAFLFDFDYHVDLILFREIMGTVRNATYFKPSVRYDVADQFRFKAAAIASVANVPVATPGNARFYGLELDGDIGYYDEEDGVFIGVAYGVLFPFTALDRPPELFATVNGDAATAQTFQSRFVLEF